MNLYGNDLMFYCSGQFQELLLFVSGLNFFFLKFNKNRSEIILEIFFRKTSYSKKSKKPC